MIQTTIKFKFKFNLKKIVLTIIMAYVIAKLLGII